MVEMALLHKNPLFVGWQAKKQIKENENKRLHSDYLFGEVIVTELLCAVSTGAGIRHEQTRVQAPPRQGWPRTGLGDR